MTSTTEKQSEISFRPLLETPFRIFSLAREQKLLVGRWKSSSVSLTESSFREESRKMADLVSLYDPERVMIDQTEFAYPISPDMQHWFVVALADAFGKSTMKKLALVSTTNLLVQISVESIGDLGTKLGYDVVEHRYFHDRLEALKWLVNS